MAFPFCVAAVLPSGRVQAAIQIHPAGQAPRHADEGGVTHGG